VWRGLSIEDTSRRPGKPLYETAQAIERIKAARAAIDADGTGAEGGSTSCWAA
jgi:2-methylisocitrate lyase-like PEP mutase family enzyme